MMGHIHIKPTYYVLQLQLWERVQAFDASEDGKELKITKNHLFVLKKALDVYVSARGQSVVVKRCKNKSNPALTKLENIIELASAPCVEIENKRATLLKMMLEKGNSLK